MISCLQVVNVLLGSGAGPLLDAEGRAALEACAGAGHFKTCVRLLDAGGWRTEGSAEVQVRKSYLPMVLTAVGCGAAAFVSWSLILLLCISHVRCLSPAVKAAEWFKLGA